MVPPQLKPGSSAAASSVFLLTSHIPSICPPYWPQEASWMQYDPCAHTHTRPSTLSVSLHIHTSCLKAEFLWSWTVPVLSSLSAWGSHPSFPLGHPALNGAFADSSPPPQEFCALLLPTGGLCLALEMPLSAWCLSHCTVSLARTGPSYGLLHPCPLAKGLSHHRYSVNTCWVFTRAGSSRVRVHVQVYPSPWSAFLTALRCLPRNRRKLCPTPSWSMLSVLWRVVL